MKQIYIKRYISFSYKFFFSFSIVVSQVLLIYISNINLTDNPEVNLYSKQKIKLILYSKKCKPFNHKTIFFTSNYRKESNEKGEKYKIITYINKKNSFVTYYIDDNIYRRYEGILSKNGLIKSGNIYGDNNIFLSHKAFKLVNENNTIIKNNYLSKYYRILGYKVLSKVGLYLNYKNMKKNFKNDFNFMPETYYYPNDKDIIFKNFKNYTLNLDNLWLIKPSHNYGGKGISILESLDKIKQDEYILNKYITNLDLIYNKKYDIRLYILISGLKPLRIYLYKDGLIRIASENFTLNSNSIQNKYIHLTNICINSKNKNFLTPNNTKIEDSNIWNFYTYEKYLRNLNIDFGNLKDKIRNIIIKSMISVYRNLTMELEKNNKFDNNFYILLGYDILVTKYFEPILLEINSSPMLKYFSEKEKLSKTNLLVDTFNIIGISSFSKNIVGEKMKQLKYSIEDIVNNAFCELMRPRGDYELIFPLKNNIKIYRKFFKNINNKENLLFWKKIIEDK